MDDKIAEINSAACTIKTTQNNVAVEEEEMKSALLHQFFVRAVKDIYIAENSDLQLNDTEEGNASPDIEKEDELNR